jgi:hypothetical protein
MRKQLSCEHVPRLEMERGFVVLMASSFVFLDGWKRDLDETE